MTDRHPDPPEGAPAAPHVLSLTVLLCAAGALLALTAVTVIASRIPLGAFNVVLALAIASLKATLVALYFMHLRYEGRLQAAVLATAVLFAALLVGFVVFDTTRYQPDIRAALEAAASGSSP